MPLTRAQKEEKVQEITGRLSGVSCVYLTDLTGMSVEMLTQFRRLCRQNGIELEVIKNTLLHRASRSTQYEVLDPFMNGPTAVMTATEDAIAPARILEKFIKDNKLPQIKAACIDGDLYDEDGVKALAKLPTREVLLSQFLSVLNAPLTGFVMVLKAPLRNLANVLEQVAKQKEGA